MLSKVISLLLTFYISYLFFHFVILNVFIINNPLTMLVNIWFIHAFLNIITLYITKNKTFGDLLVRIKYQRVRRRLVLKNLIAIRSMVTSTLFYLVIYFNFLAGFSFYAITLSLVFAFLLSGLKIKINFIDKSVLDWITGTVSVNAQKKSC